MSVRIAVAAAAASLLFACGPAAVAGAAAPAPGWTLDTIAAPTNFPADETAEDTYTVTAANAGAAPTDGTNIVLTDSLPSGVAVQSVSLFPTPVDRGFIDLGGLLCTTSPVRCQYPGPFGGLIPSALLPDERLKMVVHVKVESGAPSSLTSVASVSGGGAPTASLTTSNTVSASPAAFGPSSVSASIIGEDGRPDTQAASHPYELRVTAALNNAVRVTGPGHPYQDSSVEDVKDFVVDLPLGFVGSTLATPECSFAQLSSQERCPADTVVGHLRTEPEELSSIDSPIYNLVPERGAPAEFGYVDALDAAHAIYTRVVPTPAGYILQTISRETPAIPLTRIEAVFYGDPVARQAEIALREHKTPAKLPQVPFFTTPSSCNGERPTTSIHIDSWKNPARFRANGVPANLGEPQWATMASSGPPMSECDLLSFAPQIGAQPTTHEADKPSGLDFEIRLPQTEQDGVPATPTLKRAAVSFPAGFTLDPSAGGGLAACSEAQIGWVGPSHLYFTPAAPECPEASKIGTLELETPLIPHRLEGEMFLAAQNENPFGATIGLYVVVDDPVTGVLVKIPGKATMDPHTGQVSAEFDENPSLPFSDLKLHFFGGPRAEFATPESCGTFTTTSELTPYSAPDSGPPATLSDSFLIDEACPGGFAPSFTAGSLNLQAGAFTPFVASFSRSDTDQELSSLSLTLPPGLLGKIAGVPLCPDAAASTGACPESSRVGTVTAGAGPGPNPLFVTGRAYLTGPYGGGPYGLAVVVPAAAGPFDFGTVVVRQSLRIDQLTAQAIDVSDPFPKIIDGIPLRLRRVDVTLDRPGFMFNPTNCSKLAFNGSLAGTPLGAPTSLAGTVGYATEAGSSSPFAVPFQVTNCAKLAFKPDFKVFVTGRTSKAKGAGLSVKLSYPAGSMGTQANIGRVKVELPKLLPSRLTTLQKACLAATFDANPAACPPQSVVGHAVVHTPVLSVPLEGAVYFVSHGGEEFPNLTIVLHGNGVTVQLVGSTFISKAGITSTTFKTPPDVPFESFELNLPQGPYSALAANANLCALTALKTVKKRVTVHAHGHTTHPLRTVKQRTAAQLLMPSEFTGQNGAQLRQDTRIAVTGCPSHSKKLKTRRKARARHGKR
jgi:uncharacterized repeat protein (TIGR01451 family)